MLNLLVRGGYLVSLLGGFALFVFPLRDCFAQVLWPQPNEAAKQLSANFYPVTYGLLAAIIACAVLVPNIWAVLSLIGNVACTLLAFIIPALISLRLQQGGAGNRAVAWGVLLLGAALFVNGLGQHFV